MSDHTPAPWKWLSDAETGRAILIGDIVQQPDVEGQEAGKGAQILATSKGHPWLDQWMGSPDAMLIEAALLESCRKLCASLRAVLGGPDLPFPTPPMPDNPHTREMRSTVEQAEAIIAKVTSSACPSASGPPGSAPPPAGSAPVTPAGPRP